jgi:hypothetical protein
MILSIASLRQKLSETKSSTANIVYRPKFKGTLIEL